MIWYTKANKTICENEMKLVSKFLFFGFIEKKQTKFFALPLGYADTLGRLLGVCFFFLSFAFMHRVTLFCFGTMKKKNKLWNFRAWPMKFPAMKPKSSMYEILAMYVWNHTFYLPGVRARVKVVIIFFKKKNI